MILLQLWQQEKDRLSDILFQRVTQNTDEVLLPQLLDAGYPEFFEAAAKRFARQRVRQESPISVHRDTHYRFDDPTVKLQLLRLENALARQRAFTPEELQELATASIDFQLETLVRPRQSLFEKLYNSAESRPREDILVVLRGYGEDRLFVQRLLQKIEKSESEEVSQVDFVSVSNDVEQSIYKETPISAFMTEVDLLLKFEGAVTGETHFVIKSQILMGLLKERGLSGMVDSLHDEADSKEFWTLDEIENALERHILVGGFAEEVTVADEEDLAEAEASEVLDFRLPDTVAIDALDAIKRRKSDQAPESDTGQTDLLNIHFVDNAEEESELAEQRTATEPDEPAANDDEATAPAERVQADNDEKLAPLHYHIDPDNRELFVEKIFDGDEGEYLKLIKKLDDVEQWEQAKTIIEEELMRQVVDPYSHEAVLFGDLVYSRYHS